MATFTIKSDFKTGGNPFNNTNELLSRIAQILVVNIRQRTQNRSVDANEKSFKAYSKGYAKAKRRAGIGAKVNLTGIQIDTKTGKTKTSGRMMQSLAVYNLKKKSVEIGVSGEQLKKAALVSKDRKFLGVSKRDEPKIDKIIDKWVDEQLESI